MEPTEQDLREQVQYLDQRGIPQYGNFYKSEFLPETLESVEYRGGTTPEPTDALVTDIRPDHRGYYEEVKTPWYMKMLPAAGAGGPGYERPTVIPKNYQLTDEGKRFVETAQQEAARRAEIPDELPNETEIGFDFDSDRTTIPENRRNVRSEIENYYDSASELFDTGEEARAQLNELQLAYTDVLEQSFRRLNALGENEGGRIVGRPLTDYEQEEMRAGRLMWDRDTQEFRFIPEGELGSWANMREASWLGSQSNTVSELIFANAAFQGFFKQFASTIGEQQLNDNYYAAIGYPNGRPEMPQDLQELDESDAGRFSIVNTLTADSYFSFSDLPSDQVLRMEAPKGWTPEASITAMKNHAPKLYALYVFTLGEDQLREITKLAKNPFHFEFIANHTLTNAQASLVMTQFAEQKTLASEAVSFVERTLRDSVLASPDAGVDAVYYAATLGTGVATHATHRVANRLSRMAGKATVRSARNKLKKGQSLSLMEKFGSKEFRKWALDTRHGALNLIDNAGMILPFRWDEGITKAMLTKNHRLGRFLTKRAEDGRTQALARGSARFVATEYLSSFIEEANAGILNLNKTNQYLPYQAEMHGQQGGTKVGQYFETFFKEGFYGGFMGVGLNRFMKGVGKVVGGVGTFAGKLIDPYVSADGMKGINTALGKAFQRVHLNSIAGRKKAYQIDRFKMGLESAFGDLDTTLNVTVTNPDGSVEVREISAADADNMENHPLIQMIMTIVTQDNDVDAGLNKVETVTLTNEDGDITYKEMPAWLRIVNEAVNFQKNEAIANGQPAPTLEQVGMEIVERLAANLSDAGKRKVSQAAVKNAAVTTFVLESQALAMVAEADAKGEKLTLEQARKKLRDDPELIIAALAEKSEEFRDKVLEVMKERDSGNGNVFSGDPDNLSSLALKDTEEAQAAFDAALNDPDVRLEAAKRLVAEAGERVSRDQMVTAIINEHFGVINKMVGGKNYELTESDVDEAVALSEDFLPDMTREELLDAFTLQLQMPLGDQSIFMDFNQSKLDEGEQSRNISIILNEMNRAKIGAFLDLMVGKEVVIDSDTDADTALDSDDTTDGDTAADSVTEDTAPAETEGDADTEVTAADTTEDASDAAVEEEGSTDGTGDSETAAPDSGEVDGFVDENPGLIQDMDDLCD
jgi:hypothetical protein